VNSPFALRQNHEGAAQCTVLRAANLVRGCLMHMYGRHDGLDMMTKSISSSGQYVILEN
jgi:hypothetical protein